MSMRSWSRASIITRLFGTPLAVLPETAAIVLGAVGPRLDVSQLFVNATGDALGIDELSARAKAEVERIDARGPVDRVAPLNRANRLGFIYNRVMHVPIRGETVAENDGAIGPSSGFTGYDGIRAQVIAADNDPEVAGLLMDIDCPGGECASLFELADFLMARRGTKPMRAMIRDLGASAAYTIACCADDVTLQPLGRAGSNGIITMHADFSGAMEQDGVAVRLFTSGSHKADGNPFEPLPDEVAARIQKAVDVTAARLFAHVGKARGMKPEAIAAQQAQIYMGEEAVAAGLVDKIMSWDDSMAEFEQRVNGSGNSGRAARPAPGARSTKGSTMDPNAQAPAGNEPVYTEAQMSAAKMEASQAAATAAATAERERITALAELDSDSTLSASLTKAISEGVSAGDYAIGLARENKAAVATAAEAAKADAAKAGELPAGGRAETKPNRGQAAVDRLRGKIPGLPGKVG
ncbi:S49 family peptidase [Sphingobium sp. JS3065]|uniref:S49 family peptidase n=1 Tax=Sphingobium sp. JS3065 TaxID=2970925 RepID=UPI0022640BA0|nr:S49 family peptidase [Sphingobium sp. JS3065]UZW55548.1 S49 family peptidase [Sphingobium sp. JS3065]